MSACATCGALPNRRCLRVDGPCAVEHRMFVAEHAAGNMGAQYSEWRGFCRCGWDSGNVLNGPRFEQMVRDHLDEYLDAAAAAAELAGVLA